MIDWLISMNNIGEWMQCNSIQFNSQFAQNRCSIFFALCTPKMRTDEHGDEVIQSTSMTDEGIFNERSSCYSHFSARIRFQFIESNQIVDWIVLKNLQNIFAASMKILLWICFHCHSFSCSLLGTNGEHSVSLTTEFMQRSQ